MTVLTAKAATATRARKSPSRFAEPIDVDTTKPIPTTVSAMPTATRGDVRSRSTTHANPAASTGAAATIATTLGISV